LQGHWSQAGVGSRLVAWQARRDRLGVHLGALGLRDGCQIDCANQHAGQNYRHNLRMHLCARLTNPYAIRAAAIRAALQSNKVYPPRLSSRPLVCIAGRRINAIRSSSTCPLRKASRASSRQSLSNLEGNMKVTLASFNLILFIIGAIVNAVVSFRAESPHVAIGTGIAAFFLFAAAFKTYRLQHRKSWEERSRER
jgi:hypothetical protein